MKDTEQACRYLVMAEKDLLAVNGMQDGEMFPVEIFGFHAQQAVEKILKAWLCIRGIAFPKIHDLDELSAKLCDDGVEIPEEYTDLFAFTDFAVTFRYDVYLDIEDDMDREQVSHSIASMLAYVKHIAAPEE